VRICDVCARTVIQALSLEVSRARFLAQEPVLDFEDLDEVARGD
jgi:hypothetical protein